MKKIVLVLLLLTSGLSFSQDNIVDVIIDGKSAKMNTTTGVYTFTNGTPSSYKTKIKEIIPKDSIKKITAVKTKTESVITSNTSVISKIQEGTVHKVNKGETLYSISKKYGISMAQIKSLNNLTTNILSVNQELKIGYNASAEIINTSIYVVVKGDTLYGIARKVGITVQELKKLNNLETNTISIGQKLIIK